MINKLNILFCLMLLLCINLLMNCANASQPKLVSNIEVFDSEICVHIYSKSHANIVMMLDPRAIRYEITYKSGKDGVIRTLKSEIRSTRNPKLLGGCVFLPPLKEGVSVPTKCIETKIRLPHSIGDKALFKIISWRFIVRASIFDPADSYNKIFDVNEWFSSEVPLQNDDSAQ